MKAIQIKLPASLENLMLVDMAEPREPGPGEIKVRIRASSLNFHDLGVVTGVLPCADGRIPMSDGAGEVVAIGAGVSDYQVGDKVVSTFFTDWPDGKPTTTAFTRVPGDGLDGYAREYMTAPESWFTPIPKGYSFAEAATLTCAGVTAWRALVVDGQMKAGANVLVQGTGGVSVFAFQIAKAMGARVIATSSSNEKLARMKALGADEVINYVEEPEWGVKVRDLTNGEGVDHVVEVGGAGTLNQSIVATKTGGHIAMIGVLTGRTGPVMTAALMAKQIRLIGMVVGSRQHQMDLIRAIEVTGMKPVIDKSFPLANLADAFRHQAANAQFGKVVVAI
ncbi:MAG: zinc-dependent alcohol dehydrogenase family protein [Chakrabartia sp.]